MAVALSRTRSVQLYQPRKFKEQEQEEICSNVDNKNKLKEQKRVLVPVVYYLSRNGQLEHPHFVEVPLSSPQGLFLRDVVCRLNLLRGKSMAFHYSWSSKRGYKNGYVWHDLEENDYILPVHGGEYVLKGSEIPEPASLSSLSVSKSPQTSSSSCENTNVIPSTGVSQYNVYKGESTHDFAAADASTQTDDKRRRRKAVIKEKGEQCSTELTREEISPPPVDSSPETFDSLMKSEGSSIFTSSTKNNNSLKVSSSISSSSHAVDQVTGEVDRTTGYWPSGRMKASSVLMSLISCGSISFRDCGADAVKEHGVSLITHYKTRGGNRTVDDNGSKNDKESMMMEIMERNVSSSFAKMALEDKEYFSGSLIETNKNNYKEGDQFISLKRSSSYNTDRSSHLKLERKEVDANAMSAKCIPRKPKAQPSNKKECISEITSIANGS